MTIPHIGRLMRRVVSLIAVCFLVAIGGSVSWSGPASVTPLTSPKAPTVPVQDRKSVDVADLAQILFVNRQGREVARLQGIEALVNRVQDKVMAGIGRGGAPAPPQGGLGGRPGTGP